MENRGAGGRSADRRKTQDSRGEGGKTKKKLQRTKLQININTHRDRNLRDRSVTPDNPYIVYRSVFR